MKLKKFTIICLIISSFLALNQKSLIAQESVIQPPLPPAETQEPKKKRFALMRRNELREKYLKEQKELRKRHEQESTQAHERFLQERKDAWQRYEQEKKDAIERHKREKEETQNKLKAEQSVQENINIKTQEEILKNKALVAEVVKERNEKVKKVKKIKRTIEVITNENDPLYIADAEVINAKTNFLKIKDVELKFKITIHNQTPKIISSALVLWERKIPFGESQTILKETKVSNPITPYEKRVVEYNDLDSTRQGEVYKVKVANVIFEDGTQWKNPAL